MSGIYEITEDTLLAAYRAGAAYWRNNKPKYATRDGLEFLARTCSWHDDNMTQWLAGFYDAQDRDYNANR